jgi:hypothetical protein
VYQVQATQRAEQLRIAEQTDKLAREKQVFANHKKHFKQVFKKKKKKKKKKKLNNFLFV